MKVAELSKINKGCQTKINKKRQIERNKQKKKDKRNIKDKYGKILHLHFAFAIAVAFCNLHSHILLFCIMSFIFSFSYISTLYINCIDWENSWRFFFLAIRLSQIMQVLLLEAKKEVTKYLPKPHKKYRLFIAHTKIQVWKLTSYFTTLLHLNNNQVLKNICKLIITAKTYKFNLLSKTIIVCMKALNELQKEAIAFICTLIKLPNLFKV